MQSRGIHRGAIRKLQATVLLQWHDMEPTVHQKETNHNKLKYHKVSSKG